VGRIPYLVPMKWEDGWPVLGIDGKVPMKLDLPAGKGLIPGIVASDEFERTKGERALPLVWQWNHNPDNQNWSLTERPGYLRITTGRVDENIMSARNMLTQRTIGPECTGTTSVDVSSLKDGDFAGLCLLQQNYAVVGVKRDGDSKQIVMLKGSAPRRRRGRERRQEPNGDSPSGTVVQAVSLEQDTVYLRAVCDFRDRADKARFYYSLDGESWTAIGDELEMRYTLPHFMGYRFGLLNYATKESGGRADFDYFQITNKMFTPN
jgi:beta-xylosidase